MSQFDVRVNAKRKKKGKEDVERGGCKMLGTRREQIRRGVVGEKR